MTEITCPDNSTRTCNLACDKDCVDNSKKYCGTGLAQTLGEEKETVNCPDGSIRVCSGLTNDCFPGGDVCKTKFGYEKQITCRDGTNRYCNAGTQHCYDNDEVTCAKKE